MPDDVTTPEEQVQAPPQPEQTEPPTQPEVKPQAEKPAEGQWVEKARYDGLVRKVEELTLSNRSLNDQLAQMSSDKEQLTGQLAIKDTEKVVAVGERDKVLEKALQENQSAQSELRELRAMKAKLELVRKHNAGHVLPILERIPYLEDAEAMETVFTDFVKWGHDLAKEREQQILAGYTPPAPPPAGGETGPKSSKEWLEKIQGLEGAEKDKAWNDYFTWGQTQQS